MGILRQARRYTRVWWAFFKSCIAREMSYRTSFYMGLFRNVIWLGLALINIEILFYNTDSIAGWDENQVLLLLGLARLGQSVIRFAFRINMFQISDYVMRGQMDYILLKPISSQFTASMRYVSVFTLPDMAINVGLVAYALHGLGHVPSVQELAAFALLFVAGLTMMYALWLALAALSFWLIRQANAAELFDALYDAARYPRGIFPDAMQLFVTYAVPLAFVTQFPAQALSGAVDGRYLLIAVPLALVMLYLSSRVWNLGTRSYTSASS